MIQSVNNSQTMPQYSDPLTKQLALQQPLLKSMPNPLLENMLLSSEQAGDNQKISLSPAEFANQITNAIVQALQGLIGVIIEKLSSLFSPSQNEVVATKLPTQETQSNSNISSGSTQEIGGISASEETSPKVAETSEEQPTSFLDSIKETLTQVSDVLFNKETGIVSLVTGLLEKFLPNKSLSKLTKTFSGIFKKLMPKASGALKSLWNKGKKILGKIF